MEQADNITKAMEKISKLEPRLTELLGKEIWNYAAILSSEPFEQKVQLDTLTPEATSSLEEYLRYTNEILKELNSDSIELPEQSSKPVAAELINAFEEASYRIYTIRYARALSLAADYHLLRTRTWLENKLLAAHPAGANDPTFSINIPGAIIQKPSGVIDIKATKEQEEEQRTIRSYLSVFPTANAEKDRLFKLLLDTTEQGMVPRLFTKQVLELCRKILLVFLHDPVITCYSYLARGYTSAQAKKNAEDYYTTLFRSAEYSFPEQMKETEALIDSIIETDLKALKHLTEDTIATLTRELKKAVITLYCTGLISPLNYYQLVFRKPLAVNEEESVYEYLMDVYMYDEANLINDFPFETYALELTPESRQELFLAVTNGQTNPNFILEDYLTLRPYSA